MNRKEYLSDPRYAKVLEKMDLLGIMDITTTRQDKNGTIVWKLPIKHEYGGHLIEVGSFKSGMVRNQNCAYSNYQLNKCKSIDRYFKDYEYTDKNGDYVDNPGWTGKYNKYACKERILIPIEIDRLEYLISYCLKNYYIKHANFVANGDYVAKWKFENAQNGMVPKWKYDEAVDLGRTNAEAEALSDCGHYKRISELEDSLESSDYRIQDLERMLDGYKTREKDLENKLDTIQRISKYGETE